MKSILGIVVVVNGLVWCAAAEEKPSPPAEAAKSNTEARVVELEAKVSQLEAELERLGKLVEEKKKPVPPTSAADLTEKDRQSYMALSEAGREMLRSEFTANRDRLMDASPEERAALFREMMKRVEAANAPARVAIKEPPLPSWDRKPAASTPAPSSDGKGRFTNLPPDAKQKFIEEMRNNQERLSKASPEERAAFAKEVFERIEKEAAGKKETSAPPDGKEPK